MCLIVLEDSSVQFRNFLQLNFFVRENLPHRIKSFSREFFTANVSYSIFLVVKLSFLCPSQLTITDEAKMIFQFFPSFYIHTLNYTEMRQRKNLLYGTRDETEIE